MLLGFTLCDAFGERGEKVFCERFGGYGKLLYLCGVISILMSSRRTPTAVHLFELCCSELVWSQNISHLRIYLEISL